MRIEVLVDVKTTLGEGPLWDVEEQRLYWHYGLGYGAGPAGGGRGETRCAPTRQPGSQARPA